MFAILYTVHSDVHTSVLNTIYHDKALLCYINDGQWGLQYNKLGCFVYIMYGHWYHALWILATFSDCRIYCRMSSKWPNITAVTSIWVLVDNTDKVILWSLCVYMEYKYIYCLPCTCNTFTMSTARNIGIISAHVCLSL